MCIAISRFVSNEDYGIKRGYVLSNSGEIESNGKITYIPVYLAMFFDNRLYSAAP